MDFHFSGFRHTNLEASRGVKMPSEQTGEAAVYLFIYVLLLQPVLIKIVTVILYKIVPSLAVLREPGQEQMRERGKVWHSCEVDGYRPACKAPMQASIKTIPLWIVFFCCPV